MPLTGLLLLGISAILIVFARDVPGTPRRRQGLVITGMIGVVTAVCLLARETN